MQGQAMTIKMTCHITKLSKRLHTHKDKRDLDRKAPSLDDDSQDVPRKELFPSDPNIIDTKQEETSPSQPFRGKLDMNELAQAIQGKMRLKTRACDTSTPQQTLHKRLSSSCPSIPEASSENEASETENTSVCASLEHGGDRVSETIYDLPYDDIEKESTGAFQKHCRVHVSERVYDLPFSSTENEKTSIPPTSKSCDDVRVGNAPDENGALAGGYDDPWSEDFQIPRKPQRRYSEDCLQQKPIHRQKRKFSLKNEVRAMSKEWPRLDRVKEQIAHTSSNVVHELRRFKTHFRQTIARKFTTKASPPQQNMSPDYFEDDQTYEDIS